MAAGRGDAQPPAGQWKDTSPARAPKIACADLRALTGYEFSIDTATVVSGSAGTPEFCSVRGLIMPEVRFEVSLPREWNGRLYMFGNGGYAGESFTAPQRLQRRDAALARGFAVAWTNTGHDAAREPLATFALNPQKLVDYAYRAVHVTAVTAKHVARTYYGDGPQRAYFEGCSTGGRQGLISAQRFPDDFDGIVAGAPVLDFTGTMLHYAVVHQAMRSAPWIVDKVGLLASKIYGKCDAVDGVADGLIGDPRACRFDLSNDVPLCAAGRTAVDCFTADEVKALQAVYGDLVDNGEVRFRGFPIGSEVVVGQRSGWDPWIVTRDGQLPISRQFLDTFFRHMVTPGREIDWKTVDPARNRDQLTTIGALLNATDADLTRFRERGGRMLMYFGWADAALNPLMGVDYYERVRKAMGPGTPDFFRLFLMPGMFHCANGPGPDRADMLTAVVRWVEQGVPPDRILAAKRDGDKTIRTRPLCPYPQVARYDGRGSVDDAGSFACAPQ